MVINKSLLDVIQLNVGDFMCTSIMKECQNIASQNRIINKNSLDSIMKENLHYEGTPKYSKPKQGYQQKFIRFQTLTIKKKKLVPNIEQRTVWSKKYLCIQP